MRFVTSLSGHYVNHRYNIRTGISNACAFYTTGVITSAFRVKHFTTAMVAKAYLGSTWQPWLGLVDSDAFAEL